MSCRKHAFLRKPLGMTKFKSTVFQTKRQKIRKPPDFFGRLFCAFGKTTIYGSVSLFFSSAGFFAEEVDLRDEVKRSFWFSRSGTENSGAPSFDETR